MEFPSPDRVGALAIVVIVPSPVSLFVTVGQLWEISVVVNRKVSGWTSRSTNDLRL